jgi:hypothetical protein
MFSSRTYQTRPKAPMPTGWRSVYLRLGQQQHGQGQHLLSRGRSGGGHSAGRGGLARTCS